MGRLTLNRTPTDFHIEIEQAAFEPNNLVPGIGLSPDKMLLARLFAYADAHRARLGVNYKQIPVNRPRCPVHSYSKDGAMRVENVADPVYAPNSKGGPQADGARYPQVEVWHASGDFVRAAYTPRKDDNDFVQARALVRDVMDDSQHGRLVANVVGHLKKGVSAPVLQRALEYWRNIDREIGDRIANGVEGKGAEGGTMVIRHLPGRRISSPAHPLGPARNRGRDNLGPCGRGPAHCPP